MIKISLVKRLTSAISSFKFVNTFRADSIKSTLKYITTVFFIVFFIYFALLSVRVGPEILDAQDLIVSISEELPDFEIKNLEFNLSSTEKYKIIELKDSDIYIDLENRNDIEFYKSLDKDYILIKSKSFKTSIENRIFSYEYKFDIDKGELNDFAKISRLFIVFMILMIFVFSLLALIVSILLMFSVVLIINNFRMFNVAAKDCFKIASYSLLVPSIILLIVKSLNIELPLLGWICLLTAGIYAYNYLKNYEDQSPNLVTDIFEK